MSYLEIAACLAYAVSIWLATGSNVHTWWIGITGSILYGWVFWFVRSYADITLQLLLIATSITGWTHWLKGQDDDILPVRRTQAGHFFLLLLRAAVMAGGYGFLLHTFVNAWAPWLDSLVLTSSVLAQLMLTGRRIESWFIWLAMNILAVPLYMARGLNLAVGLYFLFWINTWHGLYQWRKGL